MSGAPMVPLIWSKVMPSTRGLLRMASFNAPVRWDSDVGVVPSGQPLELRVAMASATAIKKDFISAVSTLADVSQSSLRTS